MSLRTKKVLITGGSRGIGYEIARRLNEAGADVVITGRNAATLRAAAEKLNVKWLVWDAADIQVMQSNFDRCVEMLGGFDTLVNNAGVLTPQHEWGIGMLELTEDEWDAVKSKIGASGTVLLRSTARKRFAVQVAGKYNMDRLHLRCGEVVCKGFAGDGVEEVRGFLGSINLMGTILTVADHFCTHYQDPHLKPVLLNCIYSHSH